MADEEFASIREVHEGALFASEKAGQVSATPPYQAITAGWTSLQETLWEINDPSEDGCQPGPHVTAGPGCDSTYCACPLGQTKDERSLKDGAGPEAIVVGEACGRLLMVTATEKQGTAFVYDVTDPSSPNLLFVQHLSPASEKKNPSVAYNDGTLGEVDPESITFLSAADSPTGNAGVLFAGAWSGTLSIYEFTQADGSKCAAMSGRRLASYTSFTTADASAASASPTGMALVSRAYVPYGKGTGYAFGMGAAEQVAYDPIEKIAYVASEKGYVNLVSYANPSFPAVLDSMAIDLSSISGSLTDVDVCGGFLAVGVAASTKTDDGSVRVYSTAAAAGTAPALKASYTAGPLPDMVAFNADCSKIATANEGEGVYSSGLTDPEGSVSILSRTAPDWSTATVQTVSFGSVATSDASLIAAGVHLPLPKNAMIYFDDYSAKFKDDLDFTAARAVYTPATQLEPEYVKWSADGS